MALRFDGALKKWNAERGFGFIVADQGEQELFVHISAFPRDGRMPAVGEPLSFEIEPDRDGRKRAVHVRRQSAAQPSPAYTTRPRLSRAPNDHHASSFGSRVIGVIMLVALGCSGTPTTLTGWRQSRLLLRVSSSRQRRLAFNAMAVNIARK